MQHSSAVARSRTLRGGAKLVVPLLVALVVFAAGVPSAGAHSAMLTASTACPNPYSANTYDVDYTATSWSGGPLGAHPHIQVQYSINDGPFVAGADFSFPNQASPPSVNGSFTVTDQATITSLRVRAVGIGNWTSGATEQGPWDETELDLPTGCQPPSAPDASARIDCAAGGAVVTLTNAASPGGQSATFLVAAPAGTSPAFSQTVGPVAPGGSATVTVPFVEGETRTITVSAQGMTTKQFTFLRDCEHPAAVVSHECAASGLDVTVENVGDGAGVFSINGSSQTVAAGGSFTVNVAVAEGASVQVTVLLDGSPVAGSPFTFLRDCEHPAAVVSHECAASGLDVTVENVGDGAGVFSINGSSQTVAAGGSFTVNVAVAEGASVQVTVLLDGSPVAGSPFTFLRDCEHPAAVVSHECAASGLDVTVENVGDGAGVFSINGSSQTVAAGGSFTVNVAVAEGASVQVTVLLDGSPVAGSPFTFLRDCEHPAAVVSHECAASGLDVTVENVGDGAGVFSINGSSQTVAAGGSFTVNVAVAEGASVQVTVLLDGSPVAGSPFTFLRECEAPEAFAASNCTVDGADVTLINFGGSPTTLEVTKNDVKIDSVVVAADDAVVRSYPLGEDEVAVFRVTGTNFDSGDLEVVHDCVEVSAPPIIIRPPSSPASPPPSLAYTGASSLLLALNGGILVLVGLLALVGSRGRRAMTL